MLGLGIVAAIPGYRFGFKAKPAFAKTISLIGQSFLMFLFVGESFRGLLEGTLAIALALIYIVNIASAINAALGRRRLRPAVVRRSMWAGAGLILSIMVFFHHFGLIGMIFNSWILAAPPILHGILADPKWTRFVRRAEGERV